MTAFTDGEDLLQELRWPLQGEPPFETCETTNHEVRLPDRATDRDTSGVQGPLLEGYIPPDPPLTPFDPFNPRNPAERRPMPKRPFNDAGTVFPEPWSPLTDVFEDEQAVTIYLELPGNATDDVTLNVAQGKVEVKTKTGYKTFPTPPRIDVEKASSRYRNGVLTIRRPNKASTANTGNSPTPVGG